MSSHKKHLQMVVKGKHPKINKASRCRMNRLIQNAVSKAIKDTAFVMLAKIEARNVAILSGHAPFISEKHPL